MRDEVAAVVEAKTQSLRNEIMSLRQSLVTVAAPTTTTADWPDIPQIGAIDPTVMKRLSRVVKRLCKEAGIKMSPTDLGLEVGLLLAAHVTDPSDRDEVEAAMPLIEHSLRNRIKEAVEQPGFGG